MALKLKLKAVPPSLRERRRYVVFELESMKEGEARTVSFINIADELSRSLGRLVGDLGLAGAGFQLLPGLRRVGKQRVRAIARVGHLYVDHFRASLALLKRVGECAVLARSIVATGSLRKAKQLLAAEAGMQLRERAYE